MVKGLYDYTVTDEKTIERLIVDEHIHLAHVVLPFGEGLPEHATNANVYMTILRGTLTISLNKEASLTFEKGKIINLAKGTMMHVVNNHSDVLEFIVVKAPAPIEE